MIDFSGIDAALNHYLNKGALVTAGSLPNVMTASWGFVGVMWGKKVVILPVRNTRYTKKFIDEKGEFALSVPFGNMQKELAYCGTRSGRDTDKIKDLNLKTARAKTIDTEVIEGCGAYFECKTVMCIPLDDDNCPKELKDKFYSDGNYHNLYIAEVLAEY